MLRMIVLSVFLCVFLGQASISKPEATGDKNARVLSNEQLKKMLKGSPDDASCLGAYEIARKHPGLLSQLFSYSGDDITDGHTNLLDCFTTTYAVDTRLPRLQAIRAADLYRSGLSISAIQQKVDEEFARYYPYETVSVALKRMCRKTSRFRDYRACSKKIGVH